MRDVNYVGLCGVVSKKIEKDNEIVLTLDCRQNYTNSAGENVELTFSIPVFTDVIVPVGKTIFVSGQIVMRKNPDHELNQLMGMNAVNLHVLSTAIDAIDNHANQVIFSGRVMRVHDLNKGCIMTVVNHQDYKSDDEWKELSYFVPAITFSNAKVAEGQNVILQGKITMRKNADDKMVMGFQAITVQAFDSPIERNTSKSKQPSTKPVEKTKASSHTNTRSARSDEETPW